MVLGKLPVPGRPTIRITEGQGPTALAVGAGGRCFHIFILNSLSPSLLETARYRLEILSQTTNRCIVTPVVSIHYTVTALWNCNHTRGLVGWCDGAG